MKRLDMRAALMRLSVAGCLLAPSASVSAPTDFDSLFERPSARTGAAIPLSETLALPLRAALQEGRQALLTGRFAQAAALARRVVDAAPQAAEGWHLLGAARANLGETNAAIDALGRAGERYAHNAEPYVMQGDLLLRAGKAGAAAEAFRAAIARDGGDWRGHAGLARAARDKADAAAARAAAVRALEASGNNRLAPRVELARAFVGGGDAGSALALLERFAQAHPRDPAALLMLGRMQIVADRADAAADTLSQAAAAATNPVPALLGLAYAHERRGDGEAARAALERAREAAPDEALVHIRLAETARAAGDAAAAAAHFRDALTSGDDGPLARQARLGLADALLAQGAGAQARAALAPLGEPKPGDDGLRLLRARVAVAMGEEAAALGALEGAADPGAHLAMFEILVAQKRVELALEVAARARAHFPGAVAPMAQQGRLLGALGRYDEAAATFAAALARAPDRPELLRGAMMAAYRLGDLETARTRAEALTRGEAAAAQDIVWLASIAEARGDDAAARRAYERALEAAPDNWVALNNLAALLTASQPARAVPLARRAVAAAPERAALRHTLGWALFHAGDFASAEDVYRRLVEAEPQEARSVYRLGRILLSEGREAEGAAALREALRLDGGFDGAEDARARLEGR